MNSIAFIDTEIEPRSGKVLDMGCIKHDGRIFHKSVLTEFINFLTGIQFVCGHNILKHDLRFIESAIRDIGIDFANIIDTLYLSPLLFPTQPYHALLKDDKLQTEELNNPLNDSIKAKDLFFDEVIAFKELDGTLQKVFYLLLNNQKEFQGFFRYIGYSATSSDIEQVIRSLFRNEICSHSILSNSIAEHPIELAYCLSLIHSFINHKEIKSITPPWVIRNYPEVERIMFRLRNNPCLSGCAYCDSALDIHKGLKRIFGFQTFRTFDGEPLQERAVKAAVDGKSLLAIFPTGGGKSITFQLPALMSGDAVNGLTIVISPLQSLMKDQVDNLEKAGITTAVTINGLLDPIERAKSFERVANGSASLLYISPESLRSTTIERLILGRKIVRFVVDEAHCFSSWGQDFRVDYLYIGDFIRRIEVAKQLADRIPVSCFTATAKQKVIEDIGAYFKEKLALDLELYTSKASRRNLHFRVFAKAEEDKYQALRELIEDKNCPTIVYVSRTKKAYDLAERLTTDGFIARPYHGKMDKREKSVNQDAFVNGEIPVMVATSAFGMGVDKKDVGMVVHYEISDSLENYVQEAGRAGRDENLDADCFVLFNEEDLSKHFILLNQTKVSIKEIQQIWKAVKELTKYKSQVSNSALEIARKAGWDDTVYAIETRVTTAIAALENAGYLARGQNMPSVYATSILAKNAQEAIDKINASEKFEKKQKETAIRVIRKLIASRSRQHSDQEDAESRIDYISDHLGILKAEVINVVNLLKEEKILADTQDLTAFIRKSENKNRSLAIANTFSKIESFLLTVIKEKETILHIKELNDKAEADGCAGVNPHRIKTIINFWTIKNWIKQKNLEYSKNHVAIISLYPNEKLKANLERRHDLAKFIVELLFERTLQDPSEESKTKEEHLVEFSVHELKYAYENRPDLFKFPATIEDVEDALFYLSRIEAIKIEGGFLVLYNRLRIERKIEDNLKRYTKDDYQQLNQFYDNRIQQIHIVGEYARRMLSDYKDALQFVEDYFQLNYSSFLRKYFPGSRANELKLKMTPGKFKQLFGVLSPTQLKIINDNEAQHIAVAAGPGSGKTRVLVHKLASLLLMEDVKHEQLLMVTFSRAAATEFKKRLLSLIGNAACFVEIKTFHSYCFDLLGTVGTLEKSDEILQRTIKKIENNEVELSRITKMVLVIDEAQDMDEDEFKLIQVLMEKNEDMRVIAVGDDDQNIYEFRGASSKYLEQFIVINKAIKYELTENYRSKSNLVAFTNQFVSQIQHRLKNSTIIPVQTENGRIKLVYYRSSNLIVPIVNDILRTDLTGTTCVLTKTNDEALQITGLLLSNGVHAKLIQTNDSFNLYNLQEIRFFLSQVHLKDDTSTISDHVWNNAKQKLKDKFQNSTKLELCNLVIKDFEETNPKSKYKSDLEVFVRDSKLEDFYSENAETIFVSTMHKAKGREFDNVFIMLDNFIVKTEASKRQLYVAMTRAKSNLTIHTNSSEVHGITTEMMQIIEDNEAYLPPTQMTLALSHKDVNLGYFDFVQHRIGKLKSGDTLLVIDSGCCTQNGDQVLKFSQKFLESLKIQRSKGYTLKSGKVSFVVYWKKEETEQEIKIILPEVYFERTNSEHIS